MNAPDFSTLLRKQLRELLHAHGVYDIGAHGWRNADDPDPRYIGHTMWQIDPPPGLYAELRPADGRVRLTFESQPFEPWQQSVAIAGADFDGLMEASSLSIGLMLMHKNALNESLQGDGDFAHLHWMSSIVNLSMASDRLRDFFVAAMFRRPAEKYSRKTKLKPDADHDPYVTPFLEAVAKLPRPPELAETLRALAEMAPRIAVIRKKRNEIVHDVATKFAAEVSERVLQHGAPEPSASSYDDISVEELRLAGERATLANAAARQRIVDQVVGWYRLLIDASNEAFKAENYRRRM